MEARMSPRDFFIFHVTRGNLQDVERAVTNLKVSVNIYCDTDLNTAAHIAVKRKNPQLLALLIRLDADLTKKNKRKQTVIEYADTCESWECYELLANGELKKKEAVTRLANQQLHLAVKLNSHERVKDLIQLGADGNIRDESGRSPGQLALMLGHLECVSLLVRSVEQEVDDAIKRRDKEFLQAFFTHTKIPLQVGKIMVVTDRELVVPHQIVNKAFWAYLGSQKWPTGFTPKVRIQTLSGLSPELDFPLPVVQLPKKQLIINAVKAGDLTELNKLLTDDTFPVVMIDKEMPLHFAVRTKNLDLLKLMIRKQAQLHIRAAGVSALDLAMDSGDIEFVKAFLFHDPVMKEYEFFRNALLRACELNLTDVARVLIPHVRKTFEGGRPVSEVTPQKGYSCLHWAIHHNNTDLLQLLVEEDYHSDDAVRLAINSARKDCVELLSDQVANIMHTAFYYHQEKLIEAFFALDQPVFPYYLSRFISNASGEVTTKILSTLLQRVVAVDDDFWQWLSRVQNTQFLTVLAKNVSARPALLAQINECRYTLAIRKQDEDTICELILTGINVKDDFWNWVMSVAESNPEFIKKLIQAAANRPELFPQLKALNASLPDEISDLFTDFTAYEFKDPVITPHGDTYSRGTIDRLETNWRSGSKHDPFTQAVLKVEELYPNKIASVLLKHYKSGADLKVVPASLICPISKKLFRFPVVANNGETYEGGEDLTKYLWSHSQKLPDGVVFTRAYPNLLVKTLIEKMGYDVEVAKAPVASSLGADLVKQLAVVSLPPASASVSPVIQPVSQLPTQAQQVPSLDKIMELFEDVVTLETFENPLIYFDGRTFSKTSVVNAAGVGLKDPQDSTKKINPVKLIKNLLVEELLAYFNKENVDLTKLPPCLICPQTGKIYEEPVVARDGKTYERANLTSYLESHEQMLPSSDMEQSGILYRNKVVEQLISLFKPPIVAPQLSPAEPKTSSQGLFAPSQLPQEGKKEEKAAQPGTKPQ